MRRLRAVQTSFEFATRNRGGAIANRLPSKHRRIRSAVVFVFSFLWVCLVSVRLYTLQIADNAIWQQWASKQHITHVELASERGTIVDREGKLMAVSIPAGSVYIRPKQIKDHGVVVQKLSEILEIDQKIVKAKLKETKPFVWVQRQLPRQKAEKVAALNIPGVDYLLESKRFYPFNGAASTLIGKVGMDGNGLSGLEKVFEKTLHEQNVKTKMIRDAVGNMIQLTGDVGDKFELPKGGTLQLTLDTGIQQIVDEEVEAGAELTNAKSVSAVMIDAETGEVLAMSQSRSPNFNLASNDAAGELKNSLVEAVFEPGSIFKPIVAAAAIEEGVVRPQDVINCEAGKFPFMKHLIKDVHPSGSISFHDVVVRSSNIGMTKVGIRLGQKRLHEYLRKFGFGEKSDLGLPGETEGILRPLSAWSGVDVATHSFGQGVAVTPLQIVRAVSAIANGGKLPKLKLTLNNSDIELKRIISEKAAAQVKEMMYGVVEDEHGTGSKAIIEGVRVGGKTGTAQKARPNGKGYMPGAYVASFVGFVDSAPIGLNRILTFAVMVDEPHTNSIYGGTLAAPIFKRVMQRTLQTLTTRNGIAPKVPETAPEEGIISPKKSGVTTVSYQVRS